MIDTKIACQCGNRFKFGMDLASGRAPDGLVCPTCGAPATPACNALVDFLAGKPPPPAGTGSRPLKEIKVVCACGARYKFDLELAEQEMPGAVTCPGCQADLTPLANEEIRNYIAKHAADLATPAPAPAPAPVAAAAAPAAEPVPAGPATAPTPPTAPATAPTPPTAPAPAGTPPPAAPAGASAPAAPPAEVPASPAAPGTSDTPVSDPFGPAPTGKSSGPNLKPLEVPKPNRPPPGSGPAAPPAKPAGPSAPSSPSPAKPAAKPAAPTAAARGEPSLALGVTGAVVGALLGAALWFALLKITGRPGAYMAAVAGLLAGFGARTLGRGASSTLGGAACVATFAVSGIMVWVALGRHVDALYAPRIEAQYKARVDQAKAAVNAKTDAELRPFIAQNLPIADLEGVKVSEEAIKAFRETRLPQLRAFLADKDARAKFEAEQLRLNRSAYPLDEAWGEAFGLFGLLFILAGVIGAAKLGMR